MSPFKKDDVFSGTEEPETKEKIKKLKAEDKKEVKSKRRLVALQMPDEKVEFDFFGLKLAVKLPTKPTKKKDMPKPKTFSFKPFGIDLEVNVPTPRYLLESIRGKELGPYALDEGTYSTGRYIFAYTAGMMTGVGMPLVTANAVYRLIKSAHEEQQFPIEGEQEEDPLQKHNEGESTKGRKSAKGK